MTDDRGNKPPRPSPGASGTPASIGKALGGDLDFEPDALLDSLMQDDITHVPRRRTDSQPPVETELSAAELESIPPAAPEKAVERETFRPDFSDDEVTVVGHRDMLEREFATHAPKPPDRSQLPKGPDSSSATPLVQRPGPSSATLGARPPPSIGALRSPPVIPRPETPALAVPARPAVPRPGSPSPASASSLRGPQLSETSISTVPPPALDDDDDDESPNEASDSQRTSLTDDEIAALDELESLSPPSVTPPPSVASLSSESEPPTAAHYIPKPGSIPGPAALPRMASSQPASVSFGRSERAPTTQRALSQPPRPGPVSSSEPSPTR